MAMNWTWPDVSLPGIFAGGEAQGTPTLDWLKFLEGIRQWTQEQGFNQAANPRNWLANWALPATYPNGLPFSGNAPIPTWLSQMTGLTGNPTGGNGGGGGTVTPPSGGGMGGMGVSLDQARRELVKAGGGPGWTAGTYGPGTPGYTNSWEGADPQAVANEYFRLTGKQVAGLTATNDPLARYSPEQRQALEFIFGARPDINSYFDANPEVTGARGGSRYMVTDPAERMATWGIWNPQEVQQAGGIEQYARQLGWGGPAAANPDDRQFDIWMGMPPTPPGDRTIKTQSQTAPFPWAMSLPDYNNLLPSQQQGLQGFYSSMYGYSPEDVDAAIRNTRPQASSAPSAGVYSWF